MPAVAGRKARVRVNDSAHQRACLALPREPVINRVFEVMVKTKRDSVVYSGLLHI